MGAHPGSQVHLGDSCLVLNGFAIASLRERTGRIS